MSADATLQEYRDRLQWAYLELKKAKAELAASKQAQHEPVAIIGIGCRFANNITTPEAFWQLLRDGVDAISDMPAERRNVDALYDPDPQAAGKMSTRWGSFIHDMDQFDAPFFGISPREAACMDPHHRLFLEVAWEALEDAGLPKARLAGRPAGVYAGMFSNDYFWLHCDRLEDIDIYSGTGTIHDTLTGRLSYLLDLRGPSMPVDTACSSSLVAVHLACQSLLTRETDLALAGGVNLLVAPLSMVMASRMGIMAADGRCKTFDARADGFVRGEGCGVVVLKRLSDALAAGDHIWAIIQASALNQDGLSASMTAPSMLAQQDVIRQSLQRARLSPQQIGYIESHGTGTRLGDPIEVEALAATYGQTSGDAAPCAVGSVKTNIGHLDAAAGIAGLIKAVLALRYEAIPPHLHLQELNPHISLAGTRLTIPTSLQPWPAGEQPRYAAVSSFGWSGTNAHAILTEAPAPPPVAASGDDGRACILPLSARSPQALIALAGRYRQWLQSDTGRATSLHDTGYTTSVRRTHFEQRLAVVGHDHDSLAQALQEAADNHVSTAQAQQTKTQPRLAFVFSGQGSQWLGMGRQLCEAEPVFRAALEACEQALLPYTGWRLREELTAEAASARLNETTITQPAIFAIQVALAALWRSWGIEPDAIIGHSLGEIAAAHVAGALTLDEAVRVVVHRSRLMQTVAGQGKTALVGLPLEQMQPLLAGLEDRIGVAGCNSPATCVLSGDTQALEQLQSSLQERNIFCRLLKGVDIAFHSPQMEPLKPQLVAALAALQPRAADVPLYSTVTGERIDGPRLAAAYWGRNLREPFRFAETIAQMLHDGYTSFLEVSPHPVLAVSLKEILQHHDRAGTVVASLRREADERLSLLGSCAQLYTAGHSVNWETFYPEGGRCVRLPTYPWQHQRYWKVSRDLNTQHTPAAAAPASAARSPLHPLPGVRLLSPLKRQEIIFEAQFGRSLLHHLDAHRFAGRMIVSASSYLEMGWAATQELAGALARPQLESLHIHQMMIVPDDGIRTVQTIVRPAAEGQADFEVWSLPAETNAAEADWQLHATGSFRFPAAAEAASAEPPPALAAAQARCPQMLDGAAFYQQVADPASNFGPVAPGIVQCWRGDGEAVALIALPDEMHAAALPYQFHPTLPDTCMQMLVFSAAGTSPASLYITVGIDRCRYFARPAGRVRVYAAVRPGQQPAGNLLLGDVWVYDEQGQIIAAFEGVHERPVSRAVLLQETAGQQADGWYQMDWQPQPLPASASPAARNGTAGRWLIFADRQGVGQQLCDQLRQRGIETLLITAEHLDPTDRAAFQALLARLLQEPCRGIAHLWSLDAPPAESLSAESLGEAQQRGCLSVLLLVQALMDCAPAPLPRLVLVTREARALAATDTLAGLAQTPLWGLGRVIQNEHPELRCSLVDLDQQAASLPGLVEEITSGQQPEEVALRGGQRFVARLVPHRPPLLPPPTAPRFAADATYLITGGLGGIGLAVARWLVQQGARHLVLMGRRGIPSPATAQAIEELRDMGAHIHIGQADVASDEQVQALLDYIDGTMPPLRGVFHAAGVARSALLLDEEPSQFESVLAPKVGGAWALHRLTQGRKLDLLVLFSSTGAVLVNFGQSSYGAANAFLDGLAHYRQHQQQPTLSINWGTWENTGMAANASEEQQQYLARYGFVGITQEQGIQFLERLLAATLAQGVAQPAQVVVAPMDWQQVGQVYQQRAVQPLLSHLVQPPKDDSRPREQQPRQTLAEELRQTGDAAQRLALIERSLRGQIASALGVSPAHLNAGQSLAALGLDSLMAMDLKRRLEHDFAVTLPMSAFLKDVSLARLTRVVLEHALPASPLPAAAGNGTTAALALPPALQPQFGRVLPQATLLHTATPSPLLVLQPAGTLPPLVWVHGGFGDVLAYQSLVQAMGETRPVYAFQAADPQEAPTIYGSVEAMAAAYRAVLQAHLPGGPYLLAGWSLGGVVAYEMAHQLRQSGEHGVTLLLLDSWLPDAQAAPLDAASSTALALLHLLQALDLDGSLTFEQLQQHSAAEQMQMALEQIKAGRPGAAAGVQQVADALRIYQQTVDLLRGYEPPSYGGPVIHLRASEPLPAFYREHLRLVRDWRAFPATQVAIIDVPGDHVTMLREPFVRSLAAHLRDCLAQAEVDILYEAR